MNKNNRKNKRIYKRILALMLCCFCLLATVPISSFALETGKTQITEESISEQQSRSSSESLPSLSSETSESQTETDTQQSTSDEMIEPIIENETDAEVETEVNAGTETNTNTETETETDAAGSETETGTEAEVNAETEAGAETETELKADGEIESETGGKIAPDESEISNVQGYTDALNLFSMKIESLESSSENYDAEYEAIIVELEQLELKISSAYDAGEITYEEFDALSVQLNGVLDVLFADVVPEEEADTLESINDAVSVYTASGSSGNGNMKIAAVYYDTVGNCHILVDVRTNNLENAVSKMQGNDCYVVIDPLVGESVTVNYPNYNVTERNRTLTLVGVTFYAEGAGFADIEVGRDIELSELFKLTVKATTGQGDNSWNIDGEEVEVVIEYTLDKQVSKDGENFGEKVVAKAGDEIVYKIVVANSAGSNVSLTGVKLEDKLPADVFDLNTVKYSLDGNIWEDAENTTTIILNGGLTVEKGSSVTYYIKAKVLSELKVTTDTTYTNTAYTSGNTIVGDSDTAEFVVEAPKVCNLTISKKVGGNMGDQGKEFAFTATLSGEGYTFDGVTYSIDGVEAQSAGNKTTCDFTLKHGQSITFTGLPIGAAFTVTEASYAESGYVTTVDDETKNSKEITLAEKNNSIAFVNTKNVTIDTGVLLDTLPYILILGVVAVGAVLLIKKRINRDDD